MVLFQLSTSEYLSHGAKINGTKSNFISMLYSNSHNKTDGANNNSIIYPINGISNGQNGGSKDNAIGINAEDLCCCEYINSHGERSHLMTLLCDCAELDDTVDRFVKGDPIPASRSDEILTTIEDR